MKNINIKILSLLVAMTGFFASCSQEELVKADFDKEYAAIASELPTIVSIDTVSVGAFDAVVDVTIKGGYENILELAIVFADNESLNDAGVSFVYTESLLSQIPDSVVVNKEEGFTFRVPVKGMKQSTHYYLSAYASVRNQPIVNYEGELPELTTQVAYEYYCTGGFTTQMFGGAWYNDMEKHKFEAGTYRLPDYIVEGYDLVFTWNQETNEVAYANATWETGYVHPNYGMIYATGLAAEFDPETATFAFTVEYTVAAGSFGTYTDTFVILEY